MRMGITAASVATLGLVLIGCGRDDETTGTAPAEETSATPETTNVTVMLYDQPPLDVLYNGDGGTCTSNFLGLSTSSPSVTLYDADGSIVGTQELEDEGGSFDRASGCSWTLVFDNIEPSDFYEASLSTDQFEYSSDPVPAGESVELVL